MEVIWCVVNFEVKENLRDGGEHALVQAEQDVGDLGATDRGLSEGLHEAEVGKVADEAAAGVREG